MKPFARSQPLPEQMRHWAQRVVGSTTGRGVGICLLLTLGALPLLPQPAVATAGLGVFAVAAWLFVRRLGRDWPLRELAWLVACLQWLAGPFLSFYLFPPNEAALIEVGDDAYFAYALPGTLAYGVGLLIWPVRRRQLGQGMKVLKTQWPHRMVWVLMSIGLLGYALRYSGWQDWLFFVYFLMGTLLSVAAAQWLLTRHPWRGFWVALCLLPLLISCIHESMFIELVLAVALLTSLWWWRMQPRWQIGLLLLVGGVVALLTLETLKQEYRNRTLWNAQDYNYTLADKVRAFPELWVQYVRQPLVLWQADNLGTRLPRFSHAWLLSQYMAHTPDCEPYARGATYRAGFHSLLPRFLAPDKKWVGGQDTYLKFAGRALEPGTSISLTHLGEAYVNFGPLGGIICMLGIGMLFGGLYAGFLRWVVCDAASLPWVIFIFPVLPVAEVDFGMLLNYIFKASLVFFVVRGAWGWLRTRRSIAQSVVEKHA